MCSDTDGLGGAHERIKWSRKFVQKNPGKGGETEMWDMPENQLIQTAAGDCGLGAEAQMLVGTKEKKEWIVLTWELKAFHLWACPQGCIAKKWIKFKGLYMVLNNCCIFIAWWSY